MFYVLQAHMVYTEHDANFYALDKQVKYFFDAFHIYGDPLQLPHKSSVFKKN